MKRKIIFLLIVLFILSLSSLIICNNLINKSSKEYLYNDVNAIPFNKVGLLLGTSRFLSKGVSNPYFENRIKAAVDLYQAGKIKYIVISGDNSLMSYNEPRDMRKRLLKDNIPDSCIFLDFAGFRTFDSVIRCKEIFGQDKFTVISQQFHNERAIYISHHFNIDAIGYDAEDVDSYNGFTTNVRELFARVKLFIDIYITHERPKFLGEKINIP